MHNSQDHIDGTQLGAAAVAAAVLGAASALLLWRADSVGDAWAVAGAIGAVIAGALLGLTLLATWWSRRGRTYVSVAVDEPGAAGDQPTATADSSGEAAAG